MRTAFALSTGRTGTKFLAHYLDRNYPDVVAVHEPPGSRWLRVVANAYQASRVRREFAIGALRRARRQVLTRPGADLYVESNPFLSGMVDLLGEVFSGPLVIHIVRDPRTYVQSAANHGVTGGLKRVMNRWFPYWYPSVRGVAELAGRRSPVSELAAFWVLINRQLASAHGRAEHYLRVAYEEIFDPSGAGLRAICDALGIAHREHDLALPATERINPSRQRVLPDWREWPAQWCRDLHHICSPLMQEYAYGREPDWLERVDSAD